MSKMETILSKYTADHSKVLVGIVTPNGRQLYAAGLSDSGHIPIQDRIFEIGSISKVFTAVLLQTMVRDKLVRLDDPVIKYEPKYSQAFSTIGKEITLKDLMTHQSNLPRDVSNVTVQDKMNPFPSYELKDLDHFLSTFQLKQYKKKVKYSNVGVGFLGNLLANVLGTNYETAISTQICEPLGLYDTCVNIKDLHRERVILSYKKDNIIPSFSAPALPGAGVLKSTLNDMLTFLEANLGLIDHPLQEVLEETHQVQSDIKVNSNTVMGLGWMITKDGVTGDMNHWHTGGTIGFNTYIRMNKEKKIGMIIATTQKHSLWKLVKIVLGLEQSIAEEIAADVYGQLPIN